MNETYICDISVCWIIQCLHSLLVTKLCSSCLSYPKCIMSDVALNIHHRFICNLKQSSFFAIHVGVCLVESEWRGIREYSQRHVTLYMMKMIHLSSYACNCVPCCFTALYKILPEEESFQSFNVWTGWYIWSLVRLREVAFTSMKSCVCLCMAVSVCPLRAIDSRLCGRQDAAMCYAC